MPSPTRSRRRGLTLVELLAATAIVGLVLASVVQVRADGVRRAADARARLVALDRLDTQLRAWERAEWVGVDVGSEGPLGDGMEWRVESVELDGSATVDEDQVRLVAISAYRLAANGYAVRLSAVHVFLPSDLEGEVE